MLEKSILYLLISLQWKYVKICSDFQTMKKKQVPFQDANLFIVLITFTINIIVQFIEV